jgi:hypothetical protein
MARVSSDDDHLSEVKFVVAGGGDLHRMLEYADGARSKHRRVSEQLFRRQWAVSSPFSATHRELSALQLASSFYKASGLTLVGARAKVKATEGMICYDETKLLFNGSRRAILQLGEIFIAVGALFGLLFGHGVIVGAVTVLVVCMLVLGVEWLYNRVRVRKALVPKSWPLARVRTRARPGSWPSSR